MAKGLATIGKHDEDPRVKVYRTLGEITQKYHFAPLEEGPGGKVIPKNLVLMALSYLLDKNHLLLGEPGWGKTTSAKILAAKLSGIPYDMYDAMEIRGHPQKFEEKIVGRPNYGGLAKGQESVVWQGSFGLDVLMIDEGNRLPLDSQDVILQGIDTSRWNYLNCSLYEGKKPTFLTMNERTGNHENGFLPALKDRLDIVTEEGFFTTLVVFDFESAKRKVVEELCKADYVEAAISALSKDYPAYKKALTKRPLDGCLSSEEKRSIQAEIDKTDAKEGDNEPILFLQAFMAEVNYSNQFGSKRVSDRPSLDTHDKHYAGVFVSHSFSPRSAMAAIAYSKALAWFLDEDLSLDHVRYILPHIFAHKAGFTDDYKSAHGNDVRTTNESLHLARQMVDEVHKRYTECIQPAKNLIARIQKGDLSSKEIEAMKVSDYDHPLLKDFILQLKQPEKAFFEKG